MEELILDEELELIEKLNRANRFDYPTLYASETGNIIFNKHAAKYMSDRVKWYTTSEYVILLPAKKTDKDAFCIRDYESARGVYKQGRLPAILRKEKKINSGYYKLMKYKNGVAFKRYEQINE